MGNYLDGIFLIDFPSFAPFDEHKGEKTERKQNGRSDVILAGIELWGEIYVIVLYSKHTDELDSFLKLP